MGGSRMKILSSSYSKRLLTMAGIADELEAQGFAEFDFSALMNRKTKRSFEDNNPIFGEIDSGRFSIHSGVPNTSCASCDYRFNA